MCAMWTVLSGVRTARTALWAVQATVALAIGAATGYAAVRLVTDTYYVAGLLRGAASCFATVIAVCALSDRCFGRRCDTFVTARAEGDMGVRPL
ncbi:hypothetical protein GWI34_09530 [Actinomadura sp. DSM 109109]|nr:hypothetical protein [Actinomadura lepetitiana]